MYSAMWPNEWLKPLFSANWFSRFAAFAMVSGLLGWVSAIICGLQMNCVKPSSTSPLARISDVSGFGAPSSIPGSRWL